jgi:hypothetical protein
MVLLMGVNPLVGQETALLQISINENYGLERNFDYVEFSCQLPVELLEGGKIALYAQEINTNQRIDCQVVLEENEIVQNKISVRIIFPVACGAFKKKEYIIISKKSSDFQSTDLKLSGEGTELVIENKFYDANLSKSDSTEGHSYKSGQIRELKIKMGFEQLLVNVEDRLHWAPNFKRPELEYYTTIAHWQNPKINEVNTGVYKISTLREDLAPSHPEILLTARYSFYAGLPYFKFYSKMEMIDNVLLELLRNDEMAMDSMLTHMAFQRPNGEIVDVEFSERYEILSNRPIENESPWLCFYNLDKGFAFGSIRIKYDNTNLSGEDSPTYQPHTQIGEWLKGVKYWNRRLIHNHLTIVPKGSCYREDNAYLVFKINKNDKLKDIKYWAERLRNPLQVNIQYP